MTVILSADTGWADLEVLLGISHILLTDKSIIASNDAI